MNSVVYRFLGLPVGNDNLLVDTLPFYLGHFHELIITLKAAALYEFIVVFPTVLGV